MSTLMSFISTFPLETHLWGQHEDAENRKLFFFSPFFIIAVMFDVKENDADSLPKPVQPTKKTAFSGFQRLDNVTETYEYLGA